MWPFSKNNKKERNTNDNNYYKVKNLYIAQLGYVTRTPDDGRQINSVDDWIIIQKKKFYEPGSYSDAIYGDYIGQNIFTKQEYFFWAGNSNYYDTIYKVVNGYAIYRTVPLGQILTSPEDTLTKEELLGIFYQLNKKESPKKEKPTEEVTDNILKTILETNELVKQTDIDEELKLRITKELEELGENYVKEMIRVTEKNNDNLTLESEHSVRMATIKRLVEIEAKIKNPNHAKTYSLRKQYNQFQKDLKD